MKTYLKADQKTQITFMKVMLDNLTMNPYLMEDPPKKE